MNRLIMMGRKRLVPGAVAYWDCTQVVGQVLPDLSGNGNHGQLGSTVGVDTNDPAVTDKGLVFGGDDYVICGTGADGTALDGLTVQIIAATTASASVRQAVLSKSSAAATGTGYMIQRNSADPTHWRAYIYDGAGNRVIPEVLCHPDGTYGIISLVANGATVTMYAGTTPGTPATCVGYSPASDLAAVIGALSSDKTIPLAAGSGVLAARIYPYALSIAEIAQNNAYFRANFAPLGVVLP